MNLSTESLTAKSPLINSGLLFSAFWAKYAAIISFVNLGLGFLQILIGVVKGDINMIGTFFTFLISAGITLVMSINLIRFAKYTHEGVQTCDPIQFEQAFRNLRNYFIVMGVIFLVVIFLLALFLLIAFIAALITLY